jgi:hypothetical protein
VRLAQQQQVQLALQQLALQLPEPLEQERLFAQHYQQ